MPSPWSKAKLAGLAGQIASGLRSKRAAPLPVQTGFPTSLADLVVKNRTRLKKRRKPCDPSPPESPRDPDRGPSATGGSPSNGGDRPLLADRIDGVIRPIRRPGEKGRRRSLGLDLLMAKVVLLVALAIGGKRLVIGITALAFGLVLLELRGVDLLKYSRPCRNARKSLDSMIGGLDLTGREMVSPIREVEDSEGRSDSLESVESRDLEGDGRVSEANRDVNFSRILEKKDFDRIESVSELNKEVGSSKNVKAKKFFRKVFRKKRQGGKDRRDAKDIELSSMNEEKEVPKGKEAEENSDEIVSSFGPSDRASNFSSEELESIHKASDGVSSIEKHELDVIRENVEESARFDLENVVVIREVAGNKGLGSSWQLVFFIIVLSGLMGGKAVALVLAMAWFLSIKLIDTIWSKSKRNRADSVVNRQSVVKDEEGVHT